MDLINLKLLSENADKWTDVNDEKLEELRNLHKSYFLTREMSTEELQQLKDQLLTSHQTIGTELLNSVSSTYNSLSKRLDTWYKKSKDNYNNYMSKRKVEAAKTKSNHSIRIANNNLITFL